MYDFNEHINRYNTYSLKYDTAILRRKPKDVLPLWVADMDFKTIPQVTEELKKVAEHGIFGYSEPDEEYYQAVADWFSKRHNWNVEPSWVTVAPSVMFAISTIIQEFTNVGDSILIQQPVYYPFSEVVENTNRRLVNNELVLRDGKYYIDFIDFENKIVKENVKIFLLCSPHNPVGRVWTREELLHIGEVCLKHNVLIVADEIHCDFVYKGYQHLNFANLDSRFKDITLTCTSPSKSFNLASLMVSNVIVSNTEYRRRFRKALNRYWYANGSVMGLVACKTAYQYGGAWLDELNAYISDNLDYLREYINTKLSKVKLIEPEGTYLVWLDFRNLNLPVDELENLIINKAKLWLDSGTIFGKAGEGFQRVNIACTRATLEKALNQLEHAINSLGG
jgi:cystathionine beta-lyase